MDSAMNAGSRSSQDIPLRELGINQRRDFIADSDHLFSGRIHPMLARPT